MNRSDLEELEAKLLKLTAKVRALGGYSAHAEHEMIVIPALYEIVRHLRERAPKPKREEE